LEVIAMDVTAPGRELHGRFLKLGTMTGMSLDDIIREVGHPTSYGAVGNGRTLVQWQATGCHMAILFDREMRFLSIQHQYANYQPATHPLVVVLGIIGAIAIVLIGVIGSSSNW
jgi:hypothetical protein